MKIRVAGVPEHFNVPWKRAADSKACKDLGVEIDFIEHPGGTGAMCASLASGDVDVGLLLTEGAVSKALNPSEGQKFKLFGIYVDSPLLWGVHVGAESHFNSLEDLKSGDPVFAISRFGSGSNLMSFVLMKDDDFSKKELQFKVVKNLKGAQEALPKDPNLVFLWEHFMTAPLVERNVFKRIGDVPTPWPCFVIAVREGFLEGNEEHEAKFDKVLEIVKAECDSFKNNSMETIDHIHKEYGIDKKLCAEWLHNVSFKCRRGFQKDELRKVAFTLHQLGQLDEKKPPSDKDIQDIIF